jgi:uncharacterized C2H2 Zn-finger protein
VSEIREKVQQAADDEAKQSLPCRYPNCQRIFKRKKNRENHEAKEHQLVITDHKSEEEKTDKDSDHVLNYSKTVLLLGLLHRNFQDAVKEGDGERVARMWKHLMLYFRARGKTKYALESLFLHVQLNSILTPQEAHCLKWNRSVNNVGGAGKNIACDQAMEHTIKTTKTLLVGQGANFSMERAEIYSRSTNAVQNIIENFDQEGNVKKSSSRHVHGATTTDVQTVLYELKRIDALDNIKNGRKHKSFHGFAADVLAKIDPLKLHKWINSHKKNIHNFWE